MIPQFDVCRVKMSCYHFCEKGTYGCIGHKALPRRQQTMMANFRARERRRRIPLFWVRICIMQGIDRNRMIFGNFRSTAQVTRFMGQVNRIQHFGFSKVNE